MTTDQIIYLVLGGAGLGVLMGALTRVSPGGGPQPRRAADSGPDLPQPPPTVPEPPLTSEEQEAAVEEQRLRHQHALAVARQNRLREIARRRPKPE
ncbi:Uncharacterised protein [Amycolatopsis camponoti]|uniref:Uncharacterized protein n=1 Tax=Amycolatopsis camponoti TaxID=2606593 RepID=A0A6I8MA15_9PSEU|nr:hypothetical protein [Amycolatopsis camponoti]VVJ24897.1 Uncharacterised protein [Amycolatopsis camponoti]